MYIAYLLSYQPLTPSFKQLKQVIDNQNYVSFFAHHLLNETRLQLKRHFIKLV